MIALIIWLNSEVNGHLTQLLVLSSLIGHISVSFSTGSNTTNINQTLKSHLSHGNVKHEKLDNTFVIVEFKCINQRKMPMISCFLIFFKSMHTVLDFNKKKEKKANRNCSIKSEMTTENIQGVGGKAV